MIARIRGVGSYLPRRVVTNAEVAKLVAIPAERIERLFDVRERRWARRADVPDPEEGERCSQLGAKAAERALENAGLAPGAIDTVVTASMTPDFANPSLDRLVATELGLRRDVFGVDLRTACAGLFRAVVVVESLMASGRVENALIVTTETISPFLRFGRGVATDQRLNAVLYGDGAGALVVTRDPAQPTIRHAVVCSTGDAAASPVLFGGMNSAFPPTETRFASMDYLGHHDFRTVLARGSELGWRACEAVMQAAGSTLDDYAFVIAHQATGDLQGIAARFGIPEAKLPTNIGRVGNTVSASNLILLDELIHEGRIGAGDRLLLVAAESSTWSFGGMEVVWPAA